MLNYISKKVSNMLLLLMITVALELASADDFLKECPVERELYVDNDRVINILHTFYNDLSFIQASAESPVDQNYEAVKKELSFTVSSGDRKLQILSVLDSLEDGKNIPNAVRLLTKYIELEKSNGIPMFLSYLYYFYAEAYRLAGFDASEHVRRAIKTRKRSYGISLNELERLDGLVVLQRVSKFNQEVDKLYGLEISPDFERLQTIHARMGTRLDPLITLRPSEMDRLLAARVATSLGMLEELTQEIASRPGPTVPRVNPDQDNFNRRIVAKASVEGILCEFARKLAIVGASSFEAGPTNHASLVNQIKQVDEEFAEFFKDEILEKDVTGKYEEALKSIEKFLQLDKSSNSSTTLITHFGQKEGGKLLNDFALYYRAEMYRLCPHKCRDLRNAEILIDRIKQNRQTHIGVSLGKILELEGKIVLLSVQCFHGRLMAAYELNGSESDQELAQKREKLGNEERRFPRESKK